MNTPINRVLGQQGIRTVPHTPIRFQLSTTKRSSSASSTSTSSTDFWQTPPKSRFWPPPSLKSYKLSDLKTFLDHISIPSKKTLILVGISSAVLTFMLLNLLVLSLRHGSSISSQAILHTPIRASLPASHKNKHDPIRWLLENSNDKHAITDSILPHASGRGRPRAAIISLVRNAELAGMMQSIRQLENRWNHKYQYPWIFFNDEPFTEEFIAGTRNSTRAKCYYAVVPKEHWSLPPWIDESRFMNSLEYLGTIGVGKGWMVSYHHMCRWNSGFFYKHPILQDYDWYWRVEPDVHYFCDIDYDVFRFMRDNELKYGFNMNILDDARSFPSLWTRTRAFAISHPNLIHPQADLAWLLDPQTDGEYNNCQFFSNFEIGSLNFWRGEANEAYFNWLDKAGGFFYERFGDAPVHTLSIAMFVPKSEIWFFRDIGYQHNINHQCPPNRADTCACQPTGLDENFYKLVPLLSPQIKPLDTCIRQFLGGQWLGKVDEWTMTGEKSYGGDGYHGYVLSGDE